MAEKMKSLSEEEQPLWFWRKKKHFEMVQEVRPLLTRHIRVISPAPAFQTMPGLYVKSSHAEEC